MPKYLRKTHEDGGTSLWPYTEVLAKQEGMVPVPDADEDSQPVEKPATPEPEVAIEANPPPMKRGPGRPRKNVL